MYNWKMTKHTRYKNMYNWKMTKIRDITTCITCITERWLNIRDITTCITTR